MKALVSRIFVAFTVLSLAGCGGGGGGSSATPSPPPAPPPPAANQPPTVSLGADASFNEKSEVTLSATASDSDGSISSYEWTQTAGETLDIGSTTSASLNFTAPVAKENITASFSVTVTDNEGLTASDDINITINPVNEIAFQAQGKVTNGSPFTANLNARVGNASTDFSTEADGSYTLDLAFDEDFADALIFITATSTSNPEIQFTNVPLTIGYLNELAGSDNILTADEELTVNLTPFTTAINGLLEQKIDISTSSSSDVIQAYTSIQAQSAADSAMAIHFVADGARPLPTGISSTVEFSKNAKALAEYNYFVRVNNFGYESTEEELLLNPDITRFSIPNAPTQYQALISNQIFETGALRSHYLNFSEDNSTIFYLPKNPYKTPAKNVSWSEDVNGSITIVPQGDNELASFEFTNQGTRISQSLKQQTMSLLLPLPNNSLFLVTDIYDISYPDIPGAPIDRFEFNEVISYSRTDANAFRRRSADDLFSDSSSIDLLLPVYLSLFDEANFNTATGGTSKVSFSSDIFTLNREPSATSGTASANYNYSTYLSRGTWEITDARGLVLFFTLTVGGSEFPLELQYALSSDNTVTSLTLVERSTIQTLDGVTNGVSAKNSFNGQYPTEESLVGTYTQPINIGLYKQDFFWFELKADNSVDIILTNDLNENGTLESQEYTNNTGRWSYNQDTGLIAIDTYRNSVTGSTECEFTLSILDPNCYIFNTRFINLVDFIDDSYFIQHTNIFRSPSEEIEVAQITSREYEFTDTPIVTLGSLRAQISKTSIFKNEFATNLVPKNIYTNLDVKILKLH